MLSYAFSETQTLIEVLGMVNHQDQRSLETKTLGIGMMIEGQNIETDTGATNRLRDLEERGAETMADMFIGKEKDQKDTNMMQKIMTYSRSQAVKVRQR
jgi:cobyrinic acid a,c-diamide synthase